VLVITDGQVSNSKECIQLVGDNSSVNRVFTLGIGSGADRHLVKGIARAGKGLPSFSSYGEDIAAKVMRQLKQAVQPCIHDVKIDWSPGKVQKEESNQAPLQAPPIYDGARMIVYKLWSSSEDLTDKVKIVAKTPEGDLSLDIKIDNKSVKEGDLLHKMFARKMIQELEENFERKEPSEVKSLITELGMKYGLGTQHTSFVAVDEKINKESGMKTRQVRNQVPHGYGGYDSDSDDEYYRDAPTKGMSAPMNRASFGMMRMRSAPPGAPAPMAKKSMPMNATFRGASQMMEESDESESDSDDGLECARVRAPKEKKSKGKTPPEKTAIEKILALTSLQTAAGNFVFGEDIESIIGKGYTNFKQKSTELKFETNKWLTALIVAFLEENFQKEKDVWELIVDKARTYLQNDDMIKLAKECLNH